MNNSIYYAIGDIHGEFDKLKRLHERIFDEHDKKFPNKDFVIVHLGDYIDRGKDSFEVVDTIMRMETHSDKKIINLKGNHEKMMIEAFDGSDDYGEAVWIKHGGNETMESYRRHGFDKPPESHLEWMKNLPNIYWDQDAKIVFVHAGIDPEFFPHDDEETHLWTRSKRFFDSKKWKNPLLKGMTIIHGHTPTKNGKPEIDGHFARLNIDTGACYGGPLTATIIAKHMMPEFISV